MGSFFVLLLLAAANTQAATALEIPFTYRDGFIWIQIATKASPRPLDFIVDTGAAVSVIDLDRAREMKLRLGRPVRVCGVQSMTDGVWPVRLSATSAQVPFPTKYLGVDLSSFTEACSSPMDGLLGADFFKGRIVQIDFAVRKLRLVSRQEAQSFQGEVLPLELRRCGMRVPVSVNGQSPGWMRLDTGCASALHWVTTTISTEECERRPVVGLAEFSLPTTQTTVGFGETTFSEVQTDVHASPIFPGEAGLLGNGLLSRFAQVTIDARHRRLILTGRTPSVNRSEKGQ